MQKTIDETNYRRNKQIAYNVANKIKPKALNKTIENPLAKSPITSFHYDNKPLVAAEKTI